MEYKISVVIPVYNAESTICRTVESILNNEEKNVEIILIDDCSNDNSWQKCKQIQKVYKNVLAIKNNQNKGVSYTRNVGIENASAPYIAFVDSDDWVASNYISELLFYAQNEDVMPILCFNFIYKKEASKYLFSPQEENETILVSEIELFDILQKNLLQFCWNKVFKTDIVKKNNIRFNENQNMGEDFNFVIDYMLSMHMNKCLIINKPLYFYTRTDKQSLMTNFGWTSIKDDFDRIDKLALLFNNSEEAVSKANLEKQKIRNNIIYHVVRTPNKTKREKIDRIEEIMKDGKAKKYYYAQVVLLMKEKIKQFVKK